MLVVDSVAALVPKAELDGEMGDSHMGLQARLMSQALRKLTGIVSKSKTCLIFINQIREKIGVMFGNPETTTGGRALKFYSSVRLDIRRIAAIKDGDSVVGNRTKVKVVKNKVASPFREAEFDIIYGEGISKEGDLLDLGAASNIIEKSGAWFSYKGERIGQGRENARQFLRDNADIRQTIDTALRKQLGLVKEGPTPTGAPPRRRPTCPACPAPSPPPRRGGNSFRGRLSLPQPGGALCIAPNAGSSTARDLRSARIAAFRCLREHHCPSPAATPIWNWLSFWKRTTPSCSLAPRGHWRRRGFRSSR